MSEHYSALAQVTIEREQLVAYLDGSPRLMDAWDDWGKAGVLEGANPARVDEWLAMGAHRYQIRRIFARCDGVGRFCRYDEDERTFTFGTFFFSEKTDDLAFFFAVARDLARYLRGSDSGFAAVEKVLWGDAPRSILEIQPGRSRFLDESRDVSYALRLHQATDAFDTLKRQYAVETPIPDDQLDYVR